MQTDNFVANSFYQMFHYFINSKQHQLKKIKTILLIICLAIGFNKKLVAPEKPVRLPAHSGFGNLTGFSHLLQSSSF